MNTVAGRQEKIGSTQRRVAVALVLVALAACSKPSPGAPTPDAAAPAAKGPDLSGTLCVALRKAAVEVKGMAPAPARAQRVLDIADAFQARREPLAQVSSDIDTISKVSCPEVRAPLLAATGSASLADAVR